MPEFWGSNLISHLDLCNSSTLVATVDSMAIKEPDVAVDNKLKNFNYIQHPLGVAGFESSNHISG